ncbi:MAG: hypothetical protein ACLGI7_04870, partial [Gammaproteobacteria bacterium]
PWMAPACPGRAPKKKPPGGRAAKVRDPVRDLEETGVVRGFGASGLAASRPTMLCIFRTLPQRNNRDFYTLG